MKIWQFLLLAFGFAVITSSLVLIGYQTRDVVWFPQEKVIVPYEFQVATTPGIDVGTDKLRLGAISPGASARRNITISHPTATHARVRVTGPGKGILSPTQSDVVLVNGTAEITFVAVATSNTPIGLYTGSVIIYVYTP